MTEYKTMRVPKEALEQAREDKRETETWGEFLQRCSNEPPEIREFVEATGSTPGDLEGRLDRLEEAIKEATNAAQSADRKLEELR